MLLLVCTKGLSQQLDMHSLLWQNQLQCQENVDTLELLYAFLPFTWYRPTLICKLPNKCLFGFMQNFMRGADCKDQQLPFTRFTILTASKSSSKTDQCCQIAVQWTTWSAESLNREKAADALHISKTSTWGTSVYIWTADIKGKAKKVEQQWKQASIDNL